MKYFSIIVLTSLLPSYIFSQSFEVIPKDKDFTHYGDLDYIDIEAKIYNNSTNPADSMFVWERTTKSPSSWLFTLCDTENCWLPSVEKSTFKLKIGENWIFNVAMYPNGVAGQGEATVVVYPLGKKESSKTYIYKGIAAAPSGSIGGQGIISYNLFPNPATTQLELNYNTTIDEGKYTISNELGVSMERFVEVPLNNLANIINIETLPNGIYLLSISNGNGVLFKKKFVKRL